MNERRWKISLLLIFLSVMSAHAAQELIIVEQGISAAPESEQISQELLDRLLPELQPVTVQALRRLYLYQVTTDEQQPWTLRIIPELKAAQSSYDRKDGSQSVTLEIIWEVSGVLGTHRMGFTSIGVSDRLDHAITRAMERYAIDIGYTVASVLEQLPVQMISTTFNGYLSVRCNDAAQLQRGETLTVIDPDSGDELAMLTVVQQGEGEYAELLTNYSDVPLYVGTAVHPAGQKPRRALGLQLQQSLSSSTLSIRHTSGSSADRFRYHTGLDLSIGWKTISSPTYIDTSGVSMEITQGFSSRFEPGGRYDRDRPWSAAALWFETGADLGLGLLLSPSRPLEDSLLYSASFHGAVGWYLDSRWELALHAGYRMTYRTVSAEPLRSLFFAAPAVTFRW
jgi:hypothetical protein